MVREKDAVQPAGTPTSNVTLTTNSFNHFKQLVTLCQAGTACSSAFSYDDNGNLREQASGNIVPLIVARPIAVDCIETPFGHHSFISKAHYNRHLRGSHLLSPTLERRAFPRV